jgi:hypothetical protein
MVNLMVLIWYHKCFIVNRIGQLGGCQLLTKFSIHWNGVVC